MASLDARLGAVMERGGLTPADLSRWFQRPYKTVYGWTYYGREPCDIDSEWVYRRLEALESLLRGRRKPLVPDVVGQRSRASYLEHNYGFGR